MEGRYMEEIRSRTDVSRIECCVDGCNKADEDESKVRGFSVCGSCRMAFCDFHAEFFFGVPGQPLVCVDCDEAQRGFVAE